MFLPSFIPTFAIATGLIFASPTGQNVRVEVMHFGNKAVKAEIVGLDKNDNPVDITAFPNRVTVSKDNSRKVFVKVNDDVYKVCSETLAHRGTAAIKLRSCVWVRDKITGGVIKPSKANSSSDLGARLRNGLNQTGIQLIK